MKSENERAVAWIVGDDTGISSKTIWSVMMGAVDPTSRRFRYDVPHDPSDFGRCYRLLVVMPEWRRRIGEVAERFPEWAPMVEAWDELEAMYEAAAAAPRDRHDVNDESRRLYRRMRELRGAPA